MVVLSAQDGARLIFGQAKVAGEGLRSLVVVHITSLGVRQFLRSTPGVLEVARDYLKRNRMSVAKLTDIKEEPSQTAALAANLVAAAFSDTEACLDFYHASPFVMMSVKSGGDFAANPVVRVSLPTVLFVAMCEKLESMKAQIQPVGDELEEEQELSK